MSNNNPGICLPCWQTQVQCLPNPCLSLDTNVTLHFSPCATCTELIACSPDPTPNEPSGPFFPFHCKVSLTFSSKSPWKLLTLYIGIHCLPLPSCVAPFAFFFGAAFGSASEPFGVGSFRLVRGMETGATGAGAPRGSGSQRRTEPSDFYLRFFVFWFSFGRVSLACDFYFFFLNCLCHMIHRIY